ncbi:MAG: replicative DNA helicase [Acidaminococcus sp.]|jgi:replicative DNA helicase|nr:replicative DNA helicase [Acidaminococcus sp.]MCI2114191.1 replicative DNA helicase [Acidaminococcus sp.]MCI2116126.1 replicative DNA helicase [Acidaminococcus sp.]
MEDRIPPQNIEAEQSVLGAMLISRDAIDKVSEILTADDFYRNDDRILFSVIMDLHEHNKAVDIITVTEALRQQGKLDEVGGTSTITALSNAVPTAANVVYHAKIVEEKSLRRQLIKAGTEVVASGYEEEEDIGQTIDLAEQKILSVANKKHTGNATKIKDIVKEAMNRIEELYDSKDAFTGLPTGFADFDKMTSGLQPSDLIIVAARPSMGKSSLVLNIAEHVALKGHKSVAFFSLEMSKEQLVQRLLCSQAGIDASRLRIGQLKDEEWPKLVEAADRLSDAKIMLDDTPGMTALEMRSRARRWKNENGLDLIIVDYLQLMQGSSRRPSDNRQQEMSEISRSLKGLARELNVPVIALSQLSRSVESRTSKRPMLSDLRESGALEQDADIVAFIYREDYYNPDTENKNIAELIIAKHRNGPVGTVQLFFQKDITRFYDLTPDHMVGVGEG